MFRKEDQVVRMISGFLVDLPSPSSLSYMWNFGSLLGIYLFFQIMTGLFLSIHFAGDVNLSFSSVVHLMRDVNMGWMIRVFHSNGASVFFLFLYMHIGRGVYYGSYRLFKTWMTGVTVFLLSMATAFLGYVLPWGQMSFWAATVITNLLSAIPYVGVGMVEWLWGGFAVGNPTLIRFFSFHFILPFVILIVVVLHLVYLHDIGSGNLLGLSGDSDKILFHPYYVVKDVVGVMLSLIPLIWVSFLIPYIFMDSENFIPSNPLVTPTHIQPEWYFLFAYTVLRSIPSKIGGVISLIMSVMILYVVPYLWTQELSVIGFYVMGRMLFWFLFVIWLVLTWIGAREVESPYVEVGKVASFLYFFMFLYIAIVFKIQDNVLKYFHLFLFWK